VTFTGFINDKALSYVYEVSDVFMHPAYADFDLTLVEAVAFGLMQIWTSDTEFPSAFEPIKDTIIIVNPDLKALLTR